MWPLLFLSIITLACILDRILFWINLSKNNKRISKLILEKFKDNSNEFIDFLKRKNNNPYSQILINIFNMNFSSEKDFEKGLEINLINKMKEFNKYGNIFNLTIGISPLLGLLGTVLGLMNSFSFIDLGSVGTNTKEVTGGISEALVSTAYGLIIAIFTISFSSYFNSCRRNEIIALREFGIKFQILYFNKLTKKG
tara:strand:+ start:3357 stop:3944 length:588 start_codon:yes stop_codon:yes gene_type:complete